MWHHVQREPFGSWEIIFNFNTFPYCTFLFWFFIAVFLLLWNSWRHNNKEGIERVEEEEKISHTSFVRGSFICSGALNGAASYIYWKIFYLDSSSIAIKSDSFLSHCLNVWNSSMRFGYSAFNMVYYALAIGFSGWCMNCDRLQWEHCVVLLIMTNCLGSRGNIKFLRISWKTRKFYDLASASLSSSLFFCRARINYRT